MWRRVVLLTVLCGVAAEEDPADAYLARGVEAYQAGALQDAHDAFTTCLHMSATRTDCMTNLASVLDDMQEKKAAEELYRAVIAVEPNHSDAIYNLALLLQDKEDAYSGNAQFGREAVHLFRAVVSADGSRWDAWANMAGAIASLQEAPMLATRSYQRAIYELEKHHHELENKYSEPDESEIGYLAALYYGLGIQLSQLSASDCSDLAREPASFLVGAEDGGDDGTGSVCRENAENALRVAVELDPEHAQAEHMLASLTASSGGKGGEGATSLSKASPAFVKALFDDFSDSFDQKLAELQYRVPALVGAAVAAHVESARGGAPFRGALDAGCGTGLAGPYLRPLVAGHLCGVDLSQKMLDRAEGLQTSDGTRVYDSLLAQDLVALTREAVAPGSSGSGGVELVTAADVLVYFGDLGLLMATFGQVSSPASVLVFSCERVTDAEDAPGGWLLRRSGRFAHSKAYVQATAAASGYVLRAYEEIVPRMEHGQPVPGHLFVFERYA